MKNKIEENVILNSIIDELRRFERQDLYRCYYCNLYFNWNDADYNPEDQTYTCPFCRNTFDENELESVSLMDYIEDIFMAYKGDTNDE